MFTFKYQYPQKFLDDLAKAWGFKWTPVIATLVSKKKIEVKPMSPPTNILFYTEINYNKNE